MVGSSADMSRDDDCIRNFQDMKTVFDYERLSKVAKKDSIFSYPPSRIMTYSILAAYYNISTGNNSDQTFLTKNVSTTVQGGCCTPGVENCRTFLIYRSRMFYSIYPTVLFRLAFLQIPFQFEKLFRHHQIQRLCWNQIIFCDDVDDASRATVLHEFSTEVSQKGLT